MKLEAKRLFIGNLPSNVTQAELEGKFADYGVVSSVEVKERKNVTENQAAHFAYVQLEIEKYKLQSCIEEFSNKKWKGQWIDVQIAKESFMERLKREREEVKLNGFSKAATSSPQNHKNELNDSNKTIYSKKPSTTIPIYPEDSKQTDGASASKNIKKYYSSSSEDENNLDNSKQQENKSLIIKDDTVDELVIKNNKNSKVEKTLKIKSVGNETIFVENKAHAKELGVKESEADKKRLQSIIHMKQEYQQQKSLIKNALANIDSKPKNKIIFNDDGEDIRPSKKGRFEEKHKTKHKIATTQQKLALFDEADDENDREYNFEVKEHLEGKKGRRLMELQSKFKNDERFAMDERFLEEQSDEENEDVPQENEEMSYEEEKQKQFDILEQVLGKKISRPSSDKQTNNKAHKMMLRFDPSQPEHSKYEVKEQDKPEKSKRKRKDSQKETEIKATEEAPTPEVSKDTFYKVAVNLKDALHEKQEFSLASLFSKDIQNEKQEEQQIEGTSKQINKRKKLGHEANPFKYDSSTDEESDNEKIEKSAAVDGSKQSTITSLQRLGPTRLWTESFFFKNDDYRLQEGFDFIKKLELNEQDDFHSLRRNLKEIVRAKVRNNQRNNRPFKRKLGGKKRIRVKRALKR